VYINTRTKSRALVIMNLIVIIKTNNDTKMHDPRLPDFSTFRGSRNKTAL